MTGFLQKHQNKIFLVLLALISASAGVYIANCMKYAPWGFSDSAAYISAARNFAAGKGLGLFTPDDTFAPLLIFAPLYSILLSIFAAFKADLVVTIRILDILFFSILVAASGWLFHQITKSFWLSLFFTIMIATTPILAVNYSSMMSEPLAMVLGVPGFLLLLHALNHNSSKWLILSAILCGLSLLTRYAFVAFPAAGVLCVFLLSNNPLRKRFIEALKFGVISISPMLIWIILQLTSKNSIGARHYSIDFSLSEKITQYFSGLYNVIKYWLPYRTNMIPGVQADIFRPILLILFVVIIVFGLYLSIKKSAQSPRPVTGIFALGSVCLIILYLVVLLVIYSISTETISINERMLSPMVPIFYVLILTCALHVGQKILPNIRFPFLGILIALFFVIFNARPFSTYPIEVGNFPNGYTSPIWKENPILAGEIALPQDRPLITNAPDIVLFYLNRSAYTLSATPESGLSIGSQTSLEDMIHQHCAVLVLFDAHNTQRFEQLPDAITSTDIAALQNQLDTLYASTHGMILADNNCSK